MINIRSSPCIRSSKGFTLVEIAIVIVIAGLLLGGAAITLTTQMGIRNTAETRETLERARDALLGFAATNGRLPCPSTGAAPNAATEAPAGGGTCTNNFNGFFPARTLAIGPTDGNGLLVDAWGRPIRYAVTTSNAAAFTTAGQMQTLGTSNLTPDLIIRTSNGIVLTNRVAAVIFSTGTTTTDAGGVQNTDNDQIFVSDSQTTNFDDLTLTISPFTLYNRMYAAGIL